jgi:hypothetical protein
VSRIAVIGQVTGGLKSTISNELQRYFSRSGYRPKRDHLLEWFGRTDGIRTRDFFSAIDEQVGKKGNNAVYYV